MGAESTTRVEIRNGYVYVTRLLHDLENKKNLTKWDFLSDGERQGLERTKFGQDCSTCGEHLKTEADFAKHYVVTDPRYFNLGQCHTKFQETDDKDEEDAEVVDILPPFED